ncbi:hypothetical protein M5K25_006757 [Dendrobium thyrsiflorum]|uniref:Ribosomal protein S10 n=1 Tax=Dendrobium thyrsiflorum TaxID=117978 RepID=A0ABD0VCJ0_DENTH
MDLPVATPLGGRQRRAAETLVVKIRIHPKLSRDRPSRNLTTKPVITHVKHRKVSRVHLVYLSRSTTVEFTGNVTRLRSNANSFLLKSIVRVDFPAPNKKEASPVKLFRLRSILPHSGTPRETGKSPERLLWFRMRSGGEDLVKLPNSAGIDPVRRLREKSSCWIEGSLASSGGIEPEN